jgi:Rrf2 family protein
MKITASEEHGMRCMLQLALRYPATVSLTELSAAEGTAAPFTAKVLIQLRRAGLLAASRGRHGGYRLADPPEKVTVLRILRAVSPPLFDSGFCREHTLLGAHDCTRLADCSLRPVWARLDALLSRFLADITLADLTHGERSASNHLQQRWPLTVATAATAQSTPRRASA